MNICDRPDICATLPKNAQKRQRRTLLKRFSRSLMIFSFLGVFLTFLLLIVCGSSSFTVQSIHITGNDTLAKNTILRIADTSSGNNFFSYSATNIKKRLENHPWIHSVTVEKIFPNRLTISLIRERPVALAFLPRPEGDTLYYINRQGVPFAPAVGKNLDYPVVTFEKNILKNEKNNTHALLKDTVAIIQRIDSSNSQVLPLASISQIHVQDRDRLSLFLVDHTFPIHLTTSRFHKKYRKLLYVLKNLQKRHELDLTTAIILDYDDSNVLVRKNTTLIHS